jgi:homoserine O-acetyltransferase
MSIDSDILYPPYQQEYIQQRLRNNDPRNSHSVISSDEGHDGFLVETAAVSLQLSQFLDATQ